MSQDVSIRTMTTYLSSGRVLLLGLAIACCLFVSASGQTLSDNRSVPVWWKGNLHTHSFWSDGNDFPDMISRWYRKRGYNFLALSDHNILSRGERWMDLQTIQNRGGDDVLKKYLDAFDESWVETRATEENAKQVRLKPLNEFRSKFEKPGEFIMIEGEEISDSVDGLPVHLNATNLEKLLQPVGGSSVREAIDNNLRAAAEQAALTGRQIMVHLNHPNFGWAVTAEDIAAVTRERFIEVFNAHPSVNQLGDENHPSIDRIWDIVNTLRIDKLNATPVYGLGVDDSHNYHGRPGSHPGRAWVMVKSNELSVESLFTAMYRGDFYASSGIVLADIAYNNEQKVLSIKIDGAPGVTYETKFIGTRRGYNEQSEPRKDEKGQPIRTTRKYSSDIGEVLKTDSSLQPTYHFSGDELYVRALVTSSRPHPDPSFDNQFEQAWTQPVGWSDR